MFLMAEFFEYVGWEGSSYMNYLLDLKEEVQVINSVFVKENGEYVLRSEWKDDSVMKQIKKLEYYLKFDK